MGFLYTISVLQDYFYLLIVFMLLTNCNNKISKLRFISNRNNQKNLADQKKNIFILEEN